MRPYYKALSIVIHKLQAFTGTEAFRSRLTSIIKTHLHQEPEINGDNLRNTEAERKKIPPGTFEALDSQHGPYWTGNTAKRLKINVLSLYKSYLHDNFDSLFDEVKETLNEQTESEEGETSTQSAEEQVKVIVVPLGQFLPLQPANSLISFAFSPLLFKRQ
ncbi:hypothetical protein BCV72DRAFT_309062 [Rhizopus microsporus var. microsporus]|uniref:Uncharacterized protein n=2 Tax=Rhizopus microsporus TaxID=58291 RepID=A0A2G4T0A3_RHIZD|nr:uncharacterized protein RHIMIDRAFT_236096 [Rhizopus microsporus ATCC 52813]ORE02521.1 hypothetical protein BCV72DRAFT_309062 [Rhizopus microsporus var. microsporus]PHZ14106.1 hypothetical protein RHIMIDRAFT_236096 [Rhizopus microsporus ATCC 52813]